jgi:hypothetical protein
MGMRARPTVGPHFYSRNLETVAELLARPEVARAPSTHAAELSARGLILDTSGKTYRPTAPYRNP